VRQVNDALKKFPEPRDVQFLAAECLLLSCERDVGFTIEIGKLPCSRG
jgi:hypothetical protein